MMGPREFSYPRSLPVSLAIERLKLSLPLIGGNPGRNPRAHKDHMTGLGLSVSEFMICERAVGPAVFYGVLVFAQWSQNGSGCRRRCSSVSASPHCPLDSYNWRNVSAFIA